jgi:tRNA(fMet)-specific endonuclease VapC
MKRSDPALLDRLAQVPVADVCMSVVTKAELLNGVSVSPHRDRDRLALEGLLKYVEVLDFPEAAADDYADIRAHLRKQGAMIGANDLFIAAHARSLDLTAMREKPGASAPGGIGRAPAGAQGGCHRQRSPID